MLRIKLLETIIPLSAKTIKFLERKNQIFGTKTFRGFCPTLIFTGRSPKYSPSPYTNLAHG